MKLDRIIGKLYDYRSAIAHGKPHAASLPSRPKRC